MRFFFTLVALALAGAAQAKAGDWVTSKDGKFKIKTPTNASWARCETVHVEYIRVDGSDAEQQYWTMGIAGSRTPLVSGSIKGSGTILVPLTDLRLYKYGQQSVVLNVGVGDNMATIGPFKVEPRPLRFKWDCT